MQIARFSLNDQVHWGIVEGDDVYAIEGSLYDNPRAGERLCALSDARLLAPIDAHANKVVAIAANYGDKAGRDGPGIFMKQPGTVIGPDDSIIYPRIGVRIIHEAEVGIVIGKRARHVSVGDALDYVLGYTCVNDVSANELTNNDVGAGMSLRWKHFDTFCPLGPVIATDIDGDNLRIQCRVNGHADVDGNSSRYALGRGGVGELGVGCDDAVSGGHHPERLPRRRRDKGRRYGGGRSGGHRHPPQPRHSGQRLRLQILGIKVIVIV